ncbi:hypothetical protein ACGFY6_06720 [Streptomyces sp. NPDC048387]|uniref:hypothetical protein n=1 Tax=Streptomyces sp. NPDC048387 TaxID=3365542 RepID=UPI0037141094
MVTARSSRLPRARSWAGLPYLLGLVLLLLGLVCAHGTGGSHDATGHATTPAAAAPRLTPQAGAVGLLAGRHDPAHPVHECAPLTPRAAFAVDAPPAPAAPAERCAPRAGEAPSGAAGPAVAGAAAPARTRDSAVLRV